jgi:hypothetical protein
MYQDICQLWLSQADLITSHYLKVYDLGLEAWIRQ